MQKRFGILYLVSGPAGSGKTTLCKRLADSGEAIYATSATTREPRGEEIHGEDYYFLSKEEFLSKVDTNEFLEYAEVHGNHYGTLGSEVMKRLEEGVDVVMDIDVQGAAFVRKHENSRIQSSLLDLFVMPPSEDELRARLTGRGTDAPEVIELRMSNALEEMQRSSEYTYCLTSSTKEDDYTRFLALLLGQRLRTSLKI